jgi:hypothetical protein
VWTRASPGNSGVSELRKFFQLKLGADYEAWEYYFNAESIDYTGTITEFWTRGRGPQLPSPSRGRPRLVPYLLFAETGISLSQLPCSQAAVERAFSHLRIIIAKRKEHMLNDLLGALRFLRTNDRPTETAPLTGFGALLEVIAERDRASDSQTEARPEEAPVQPDRLEVANARWS